MTTRIGSGNPLLASFRGPKEEDMQVENTVNEGDWKDLPQDLFNLIVTHAGDKYQKCKMFTKLTLVTKFWQNTLTIVAIDLLNRSEFCFNDLNTYVLEKLFKESYASRLLTLNADQINKEKIANIVSICDNLRTIILTNCNVDDVISKISALKNLNALTIWPYETDVIKKRLLPHIIKITGLTSLQFRTYENLSQISELSNLISLKLKVLAPFENQNPQHVYNLTNLTSLKLDLSNIYRITSCCLTGLTNLSNLTKLNLELRECDEISACTFQFPRLTSLAFNWNGRKLITPAPVVLAKIIPLTNLTSLKMGKTDFTDDFLELAFQHFALKLTNLTSLSMWSNGIRNEALLEMTKLSNLTYLLFPKKSLTKDGIATFHQLTQGRVKLG